MRAMAWEMEETEDAEMEEVREMEEVLERLRPQGGQVDREGWHLAWRRAGMAHFRERREDVALRRRERLALQRQVASRYLAPTNAQVRYWAEKDCRPPCA